jgi:hypothetical protein
MVQNMIVWRSRHNDFMDDVALINNDALTFCVYYFKI